MAEKTVSIIIPAYNVERYISDAVCSCIAQTYQNIEIIVIDDGSTDTTPAIIKELCSDVRVRYIRQDNNERSAARNRGLKEAVGNFIQFLDADDILYPDKLEKQVEFLNEYPDYDFVYCKSDFMNDKGLVNASVLYSEYEGIITPELLRGNFIPIHSMLSRRNGVYFNTSRTLLEDWEYWIFATFYKKVGLVRDKLCGVRQHTANSSADKKEMIKGEISLYKKILKDSRLKSYRMIIVVGLVKRYISLLRMPG